MELKELKKELLKKSEFAKEYYKKDLAFDIGNMIIEARISRDITQAKLAKMVRTKQPSIARLERGESLPSINFLDRVAKALKTNLSVCFSNVPYVVDVVETKTTNKTIKDYFVSSDLENYTKFNTMFFSETNSVKK